MPKRKGPEEPWTHRGNLLSRRSRDIPACCGIGPYDVALYPEKRDVPVCCGNAAFPPGAGRGNAAFRVSSSGEGGNSLPETNHGLPGLKGVSKVVDDDAYGARD
jgi:hypothetical protein